MLHADDAEIVSRITEGLEGIPMVVVSVCGVFKVSPIRETLLATETLGGTSCSL